MIHSRLLAVALLPTLIFPPPIALAQQNTSSGSKSSAQLDGYSRAASDAERNWEEKFRATPVPDNIRENMRRL